MTDLAPRAYRRLDVASKLAGLALVVAGLEVGGTTLAGLLLAAVGTAIALLTVFLERPDQ